MLGFRPSRSEHRNRLSVCLSSGAKSPAVKVASTGPSPTEQTNSTEVQEFFSTPTIYPAAIWPEQIPTKTTPIRLSIPA
jgi:hypothetical protein